MRLEGLRRVSRFLRRPVVLDSLLAVLVATLEITAVRAMHPGDSPERLIGYAMAAVGAAALVARRTRPITVLAVTLAADVLNTRLGVSDPATLPTTIALYSLGRHTPARTAWITGAVSCVVFALQYVGLPVNPPGEVTLPTLGPLVLVGVGQLLRLRAELRERREQGMAEAAVRAERQRIARELHDVVAHHISVINVLVGAGRTTMATDPARAEEALRTAERTAREAMAEMRQLLHVLRADDTEEEGRSRRRTTRAWAPARCRRWSSRRCAPGCPPGWRCPASRSRCPPPWTTRSTGSCRRP
ncbi:sensor histidine kinase [Thermocatellispora tengchongensis]|uniref:sensor histidine kinase n=1 Tax=Thermocatellispora tengchongensis TaxID=1073253 RepID=UPI0036337317